MSKRVRFTPKFSPALDRWVLNIPANLSKTGKRARLFFKDRHKAMVAAHRLKERHSKFGVSLSNLDPVRLGEASEDYKLLDAHKGDLSLLSMPSLI
jgi:hypothetical protein